MSEIIEGKPQLSPGVCFICELSNPVKYWDTYRDFYGIVRESLDGRKYLCEECVKQAAELFGYVTPKDVEALKRNAADWAKKANELEKELEDLKVVKSAIERLASKPEPKAPARKTAAKA